MKYLDNFSRRVIAISLSLMGIILCATLFVATISPANANSSSNLPLPALPSGSGSGGIMMDYTSVHVPSQDKTYYEILVWDSNTGKSKLYYYSYADKAFKSYESNVQLPADPLN